MVSTCCVPNCNTVRLEGRKLKFHRFPRNYIRKQRWIDAIYKEKDFKPLNTFLVCGKHFTQFDYIENLEGTKILADNAVPSKFGVEHNLAEEDDNGKDNNSVFSTTNETLESITANNTSKIISKSPSVLHNMVDSTQVIKNISKDSFLEICRCCVVNKGEVNVFESEFQNVSFADLIYFCTNEKILSSDRLPKSVCKVCMQQIMDSFSFINKVRNMQVHIRKLDQIFSVQCQEECNDTICDKNLIKQNTTPVVKVLSNYQIASNSSNELSFKQRYKGLTKVYKQLCDILVKNKRQVKKHIKTKPKEYTVLLEECAGEVIAEGQEMTSTPVILMEDENGGPRNEVKLPQDENITKEDLSSSKNSKVGKVALDNGIHEYGEVVGARFPILYQKLTCNDDNKTKLSVLKNEGLLSESNKEAIDDNLLNYGIFEKFGQSSDNDVEINDDGCLTEEEEEKSNEGNSEKTKEASKGTQCFECPEVFKTEAGIIQHCRLTGHVMTDRFKCNLCSATFRLRRFYKMHLQRHNQTKSICEICGARVFSNNLKRHMEVHSDMRNNVCQYCGITYAQKGALDDHISHKHFGVGRSLCFICGKTFKNSSDLNKHLNIEHIDDDLANKSYQCEICKKFFIAKVSLTFHHKYSHAENPIKRPRYDKKKNAKIARSSLLKPPKPKKCTICSKSVNPSGYKTHMRIHQGVKPFECKICNKTFRQHCHLKTHMNIHLNQKPYKCQYCEKSFRQRTSLITHVRSHTGDRPCRCPICDKGFVHLTAMKKHHEMHFKRTKDDGCPQQSTGIVSSKNKIADESEIDTDSNDSVTIMENN